MIDGDHSRRRPRSPGPAAGAHPPTVAFLTATIHVGAGRALWPGVLDAARQRGINLISFPGGELHVAGDADCRNAIYDLVDAEQLDGMVSWSSTLSAALVPAELHAFYERYQGLPMVSLAQVTEDVPVLLIDSYQGMHAMMRHLIEDHGYRRLAFIRGPAGHSYAQERYRAYTDTLQTYGIPFDPDLVTPPMHWEAGGEATRILLNRAALRPDDELQAIVAPSDLMALGALRELRARGIAVPGDLALVGFNDSPEGSFTTPPLTSVAMPFYEQGARAIETLLAYAAGEDVPGQLVLPSRLVLRQSCGCPSAAVAEAAAPPKSPPPTMPREGFLAEVTQTKAVGPRHAEWAGQLWDAWQAGRSAFLAALERLLGEGSATESDAAAWQTLVSILRRHVLPALDPCGRSMAEDSFGQARVLISELFLRAQAYRQLQAERQAESLREIGQALITTFDVDTLADVLAERLPQAGIRCCYLALYENPAESLAEARLVLAYTEAGRVPLERGGQRFAARQLVPDGLLPNRRYSLVVEPLYVQDEAIGFCLFEVGPQDGAIYEALRGQISSALKGSLLFQAVQQARLAAEKADQIKTRLLANVSHELRAPLNIILGFTNQMLRSEQTYRVQLPIDMLGDLQHVHDSAEHQLRLINDLVDLSRAEIDALDLYPELLDPRPLLEAVFSSLADRAAAQGRVAWRLDLPARLPVIRADPVRLRQMLLNLLGNAQKFTEQGQIVLGADLAPPHLHIWVQNTGPIIPADMQEDIFRPFVTGDHGRTRAEGMGLGLAITRSLVALHDGKIWLESQPEVGTTFHIGLPLPSLGEQMVATPAPAHPVLLLIGGEEPPVELAALCQRQGLALQRLGPDDDVVALLAEAQPVVLAWNLMGAGPSDWMLVRRLHNHPRGRQIPFVLYGQVAEDARSAGVTSFVIKPASGADLLAAIQAASPAATAGPILIVDDNPRIRERYREVVRLGMPGYVVRTAEHGLAALELIAHETPALVMLDLMMPRLDGFEVLDRLRRDPRTRQVPVLILSERMLTLDDIKRLEQHAQVTYQSKGILTEAETLAALHRALFGTDRLPQHTSALVKRAVAYLHQHYDRPIARWEIAESVGVSEDYLSRVFHRELGLSPWDYLNRYRIYHARVLLRQTNHSISVVAQQVGFQDRGYFSRVFRKLTGVGPQEFRERGEGERLEAGG